MSMKKKPSRKERLLQLQKLVDFLLKQGFTGKPLRQGLISRAKAMFLVSQDTAEDYADTVLLMRKEQVLA